MSKLSYFLMAGALVFTLGEFAMAQNQPADPAHGGATNTPPAMSEEGSSGTKVEDDIPEAPQAEDGAAGDPADGGATVTKEEQEYLVALTKCESLTGTDKSQCVDAAKKKHGQM